MLGCDNLLNVLTSIKYLTLTQHIVSLVWQYIPGPGTGIATERDKQNKYICGNVFGINYSINTADKKY